MSYIALNQIIFLLLLVHGWLWANRLYVRWGRAVSLLVLASLGFGYSLYFLTNVWEYALDVQGHMDYIGYIQLNGTLPPPLGWHNQQPPLYYVLAALFYKIGDALGVQNAIYAARFLSLMFYTGFLLLSIATLRRYFEGKYFILASALVLFWVDGITYAGRLTNDMGVLFTHALVLYYLVRWQETAQPRQFHYAAYAALMGMLMKSNAVIGVGAVGAMAVIALYEKRMTLRQIITPTMVLLALSDIFINFGRIAYYRFILHNNIKWFINITPSEIPQVAGNALSNYIYFDLYSFIVDAPYFYTHPVGSPYFWNAFFKTLLFGEWTWKAGNLPASLLSLLFVLMLFYLLAYALLKFNIVKQKLYQPAAILALFMIAALMVARIQVPWAAQCNARYIYGIIVVFALFYVKAIEWHRACGRNVLAYFGMVMAMVFTGISLYMIIYELYVRL